MIIGHKINKINVEVGEPQGKVEIKCSTNLNNIDKKDFFVAGEKKPGLNFEFNFTAEYVNAGKIEVNGAVFYTEDKKVIEKIEKQWKKDKKVDDELIIPVLNRAMTIGYTEAIILADRVRLPSPLKMPRITPKNAG